MGFGWIWVLARRFGAQGLDREAGRAAQGLKLHGGLVQGPTRGLIRPFGLHVGPHVR